MTMQWKDDVPIYRQVHGRVVRMILEGQLTTDDTLPSVRQVAAELEINPLTVSKAYQALVDENLVYKKRGLGMFVAENAREALLKSERQHFLEQEWPALLARIERLGLDLDALVEAARDRGGPES